MKILQRRRLLFTVLFAAFLTLFCTVSPCAAREIIENFASIVEIQEDSKILVTENIDIRVDGSEISHGIIRNIPVTYKNKDGHVFTVDLKVREILLDGVREPFDKDCSGRYAVIKIGDADRYVRPGFHRYTIQYEMSYMIGFFDDHDELYWNATGNEWSWPIRNASCTVYLPKKYSNKRFNSVEWYVGAYGHKGIISDARQSGANQVSTTRMLGAGEGLTVCFTWEKGLIAEPPSPFGNRKAQAAAAIATLIASLIWAIRSIGKSISECYPPTVIPRFYPPENMSPAAVRNIKNKAVDSISMTADIVSLAVKGALTITEKEHKRLLFGVDKTFVLTKKECSNVNFENDEKAIYDALFEIDDVIELSSSYGETLVSALQTLKGNISVICSGMTTGKYTGYAVGIIIFALGICAAFLFTNLVADDVISSAFGGGLVMLISLIVNVSPRSSVSKRFFGMAVPILAALVIFVFVFEGFEANSSKFMIKFPFIAAAAATGCIIPFMSRFTKRGGALFSEVEGLNLYITTAEKNRLEKFNPPEETPQLFERILPFAIALDAAETWGKRFAKVLDKVSYKPEWYSGPSPLIFMNSFANGGAFANAVNTTIGNGLNAMSSNEPSFSPGSFSGSGGGGFSGGGGGGGGGSGW